MGLFEQGSSVRRAVLAQAVERFKRGQVSGALADLAPAKNGDGVQVLALYDRR